jgi:hypothetical protein
MRLGSHVISVYRSAIYINRVSPWVERRLLRRFTGPRQHTQRLIAGQKLSNLVLGFALPSRHSRLTFNLQAGHLALDDPLPSFQVA